MKFSTMRDQLVSHFNEMVKDVPRLYEVGVDKDKLWELYLSSFPEGTNTIYRKRPTHDCSACKHFIRNFGNVVKICDDKIETIWDFNTGDDKFQPVLDALSNYIKQHSIENVYVAKLKTVGVKQTYEESDSGSVITWSHFYVDIPASLRDRSSKSIGELQSDARASKEVFKRSLEEISMVAVDTVLELIADKSLYRGEEWGEVLKQFKQFKVEFDSIEDPTHQIGRAHV